MVVIMKRLSFAVVLLVSTLFVGRAGATLYSSYHDGSAYYNTEEGLTGRIDFAVYDTADSEYGDEYLDNGLEMPGTGQYIYAYQIFSYSYSVDPGVAYFALTDEQGELIEGGLMNGTTAQDDGASGIAPDPIPSQTQGVWEWSFTGGYIVANEHSWFLVFSSDYAWEPGSYEIRAAGMPVPTSAPEPATVVLLGLGAGLLGLGSSKKTAQAKKDFAD